MQPHVMSTKFLPPERALPAEVERQAQHFSDLSPLMRTMVDTVPDLLMALNATRQIVFANRSLQRFTGRSEEALRGLRPGEALNCIHATEETGGCGTSEFCRTCGAAQALAASHAGHCALQECRISPRPGGEALDLNVAATPVSVNGERFTIFVLTDISHEKRRRALERIFFHDILNTATIMRASAHLLQQAGSDTQDGNGATLSHLVDRLIDEIMAQRQLVDAENDELYANPVPIVAGRFLGEMGDMYRRYELARDRQICIAEPVTETTIISDRTLLRRVVGNMIKNALEASRPGDTVTLGCDAGEGVTFWVHNPAAMPREVQLQVFQRSFSTKGSGRGLGTYSMKLLGERYLKGSVSFSSTPEEGTVFRISLPAKR